jgi:hypothetical protein
MAIDIKTNSYDMAIQASAKANSKLATIASHPYVVRNTGKLNKNGSFQEFTNSCCFIAAHDKIHYLGEKSEINTHEIRILSQFPNESIFFDTKLHSAGFTRMSHILNVGFVFYQLVDKGLVVTDVYNFDSKNIVHILSWGAHFELLVTEQERNELMSSSEFRATERIVEKYIVVKTAKEEEIDKIIKQIEFHRKKVSITDCVTSVKNQLSSVNSKLSSNKNDVSDAEFTKILEATAQLEELQSKLETLAKIESLEAQLLKLISTK